MNNKIYFQIPSKCPFCKQTLIIEKENNSEKLFCINPFCNAKLINRLENFVGKKGLDIKGISKATIAKLINEGWLGCCADIFSLKNYYKEWIKMPGFGVLSVDKILKSIEEHRTTTLAQFLSALGIPLIGVSAAKDIANYFNNDYEDFRAAVDDPDFYFSSIPNFGMEMHKSIKQFNYEESDTIVKLLTIVKPKTVESISNSKLQDKIIVITGKLTLFKNRNELKNIIIQNGGKVSESVTAKTNILINNDINSTSAKNKKAKQLGVQILSEANFINEYIDK